MVKRRRFRPFLLASAMVACGAATAACAAVFGFERLSEDGAAEGSVPEGSVEAGADVTTFEAGPQCTSLGIPDRPKIVDAGASDAPDTIHMAVSVLDFGLDGSAPAGFNLDRACSPTVTTSTCATNIDETTFDKYARDRDNQGLDNAGYGLLGYLSYLGSAFSPTSINERLGLGQFGIVIRLANWNGLPDDDDVIVEIFPAIGVWNVNDAGVRTPGGKPAFDSTDQWMRDDRYQAFGDFSKVKSANAWVTGGRLVASFQSVSFGVSVPDDPKPLDVLIQEGFISGMLVSTGGSWHIEQGVIGGRWPTKEFLGQVRTLYVLSAAPLFNVVLCDPNVPLNVYGLVKKEICDGRDIRSASNDDKKGLPCDAFSAGLKINTYAVDVPGSFATLAPVSPPRCQKDGSVPLGDDCAPAAP